jgi:hypothetical protein
MKSFAQLSALILLAGAVASLTGCIQLNSETVIEKDGSGTADITISMSPTGAELIEEMRELGMTEGQDIDMPAIDDLKKEDFAKAAKGHGVKIKRFEKSSADGRDLLDLAVEFEDLEGLSYVMGKVMGEQPGDGMGIYETADGNYVLKAAHYDFPPEPAPEAEEAPEAKETEGAEAPTMTEEEKAQKQMAIYGKLMGAMAELDVKFTITVPGEIIESNAPVVEGNTSIWAINAGNMMTMQNQNSEPVITFSSKGLKIKAIKE